jgi:hypothetical protein
LLWPATVVYVAAIGVATVGATQATPKAGPAMPADATGEQIFRRLRHLPRSQRHRLAEEHRRLRHRQRALAAGFHRLRHNTVEPLADWWRWLTKVDQSADSIVTCPPSARR